MCAALIERCDQVPVGQHLKISPFFVSQRLVRQQRRHTQRRVAWQHAQHAIERRFEAVLAISLLHQLSGDFKPECVRNNYEHALGTAVVKRQHLPQKKQLLRRRLG